MNNAPVASKRPKWGRHELDNVCLNSGPRGCFSLLLRRTATLSLGQWDMLLERARTHRLSISAMAFQDAMEPGFGATERLLHSRDCAGRQARSLLRILSDRHRRDVRSIEGIDEHMRKTPLENWISEKIHGRPGHELTREGIRRYQLEKLKTVIDYVLGKKPVLSGTPSRNVRQRLTRCG